MDLFDTAEPPAPATPRVFTVTELNRSVRGLLEEAIGKVWVQGEVCNYRRQASGHQYFGLKDDKCQISCVMFHRPYLQFRQVPLSEGMAVQVRGDMTVYEARGQYQVIVDLVQPAGIGLLQAKFEALKRKLEAEGLFAPERKRALPKFPRVIGIVTSPTGAAIRDMLNILQRRAPWIRVVIYPVRVQGEGAAGEIARAVGDFNAFASHGLPEPDILVVARGGGSAEDLWAFNEEIVARAVFVSEIPVVSAVGHEIDFTISDFVADLRAPTPSAAAELIAPDANELARHFSQLGNRVQRCLAAAIERGRARLSFITRGTLIREPRQRLTDCAQRVDWLDETLRRLIRSKTDEERRRLEALAAIVRQHRPDQVVRLKRQELRVLAQRIEEKMIAALAARRRRLREVEGLLRILSPPATLDRGYSITTLADGRVIKSAAEARPGTALKTSVRDGVIQSIVT